MASIKQSKPSQQFEWTRYLHACSCSNCGFYYIPNFLLLPLPSAWFITGKEQYRWCFFLFIILGPPDSYFLQMHHCFAGSGCQLAFLVLVCHGIINLIYFTSFFFPWSRPSSHCDEKKDEQSDMSEGIGITCPQLAPHFVFQIYR